MRIFVISHKDAKIPNNKVYRILRVGNCKTKDDNVECDDTGENISVRNQSFCELTGLFWVWKNIREDIVGIVHYRRYFFKNRQSCDFENVLDGNTIRETLSEVDIIVPEKQYIAKYNVEEQYGKLHYAGDLRECREAIKRLCPDYLSDFDEGMKKHVFYPFNMFIAKKNIYDEYCGWLFPILFEVEKHIDLSKRSQYNQRVYGFLGERLFNVWLLHNRYRVLEVPVLNLEKKESHIKYVLRKMYVRARYGE